MKYSQNDKYIINNNPGAEETRYSEEQRSIPKEKISHESGNILANTKVIICLLVTLICALIISLGVILYLILRKKPKETNKDEESQGEELQEYSFTALYKVKDGKNLKVFNPSRLGLQKGEYFIYEKSKNSSLRRMDEIDEESGVLNFTKDGYVTIKVNFTSPLSNLNFMFEGCEDLINVNLSQINSPIDSMIYTFTNCKNLHQVDFSSLNTSNVSTMDFLFAGCDNLVELTNFENLNTSSVKKTAGMFVDCERLMSVNLSSFELDNIEEPSGMFINNPSLRVVDLGNCTDANQLFSTQSDFNLTIIANDNISIINESLFNGNFIRTSRDEFFERNLNGEIYCDIGEGELCKECNDIIGYTKSCKSCNKGYYLPTIINYYLYCEKCTEGCNDCYLDGDLNLIICSSCDEGYKLFDGKCIKDCIRGEKEKCLDCKTESGENNQCLNCNEGYYFDISYSLTECKKIEIDNCTNVDIESNFLKCTNCSLGFMLYNNTCIKSCDIGENEKCLTCNPNYEQREFCESCNSGFYLNSEIDPTKCQICEINNNHCQDCQLISGNLTCISCKEGYTLINKTCFKSCDINCENCYYDGINEGECLECKESYFLKENYTLIGQHYENKKYCSKCPEGCSKCKDFFIGSDKISLNCTTCINGYKLKNSICEKQCDVGENNLCLTCNNNIKNFCETCNLGYYLDNNTGSCNSCEVDNCVKCERKSECHLCIEQYVPLNGICFKTCQTGENEKCHSCNNTLFEITENCLDCNEGFYLPIDSEDRTKCKSCGIGCLNCYGKVNESICYKCKEGFLLYNNECTQNCLLGSGELCLTCDSGENGLYCGSCNEGYYLPINLTERKRCKKCRADMINCHQDENNDIIPDQCYYPFIPSGKYCMEQCVTGYETNCSSCSQVPGEIDKCGTCLTGFYLPIDSSSKKNCSYCGSGCKICNGTFSIKTCTECWNDYMLYKGKCIKNCTISNHNNYCKSCNPEPGKNDRCLACNEGYYLPTYSTDIYFNRKCTKCPDYCKNCNGDYNNSICTSCISDYYHLKNDKCVKNCKYLTLYTQCNKDFCFESEDLKTYANCTKCIEGYYLPKIRRIDDNYNKCFKCSLPGCIRCEGENNETNICLECTNNTEPLIINGTIISCYQTCEIGEGGKCKSCNQGTDICSECNKEYTLYKNKCVLEYHIFAKYKTTDKNEYVQLMNYNEISKLKINDTIISNPDNYYYFENPGEHNVYIKLREIDVFSNLFTDITNLIYIEFSDNFESSEISFMNDCFSGCINLISIDMSRLDLSNNQCFMHFFQNNKNLIDVKFPEKKINKIRWFYNMFEGCEKLTSIDMSNVYNDNAEYYQNMFYGCTSLNTLILTNFRKSYNGYYKYNLFKGVPKNATIMIKQAFYGSVEDQLKDYTNVYKYAR